MPPTVGSCGSWSQLVIVSQWSRSQWSRIVLQTDFSRLAQKCRLRSPRVAQPPHVHQVMFENLRKDSIMSRIKSIFAVLVLTAMVGIVPQVQAQTFKVVLAGSSALWQTLALGAYNNGTGISGATAPTFHWTSASNAVNLTDTRPQPSNNDAGTIWVVWDSAATPNVWVFDKVDSVVGDRCYFAQPHCNVNAAASVFSAAGAGKISSTLWGADTNLPSTVQAVLTTGVLVTAAATDIRPEDAAFAMCRVNSALGASAVGGASSDGLDGLGYNVNNASGACPKFVSGQNPDVLVGSPVISGVTVLEGGSTASQANVLAFNITGKDPFSNTTVPAFTVTAVGAAPIVFINGRSGALANLTNATEDQLQQVFSGTNCDASAFGLSAGSINIFLREPLSGTMNTTEATVFRRPTVYPGAVLGVSQESNVNGGTNNPLTGQSGTCLAGSGFRYRAVGTSEEVAAVQDSNNTNFGSRDGIGYTFFSYGNVNGVANKTTYGYITLNGVDPIFQTYGSTIDPGQPATAGTLPAAANLPATCAGGAGNFPCNEAEIWSNGFSFPNLRNGTYRAWSLLRIVSNGTASTNAVALANASNQFVVSSVPDYVSFKAETQGGTADLGLKLLRSHYEQISGSGTQLGVAGAATNSPEKGGDMGGLIIPTTIGVTTYKKTQLVQNATSGNTNQGPVVRP